MSTDDFRIVDGVLTSYTGNASVIQIPEGVQSIGNSAFAYCRSLTSITIPDSIQSIGYTAFKGCTSLTSITIPDSVQSIGDSAFAYCYSLTSITIPDSVQSIGNDVFDGCNSLMDVNGDANTMYKDGLIIVRGKLVNYNGSNAVVIIPDNVQSIGNRAFSDCTSLTSITIPNSVQSMGNRAFFRCESLKSITIPDNVQSIGKNAFSGCKSLESVTILNGVKSIGNEAFSYCGSLREVTIPDSVESIGSSAFEACTSLKSVTILNGVQSIGDRAFYSCKSLTGITIPDSVQSIGNNAFYGCDLLRDVNGDANTMYKDGLIIVRGKLEYFNGTNVVVTIPDNVQSIEDKAFSDCKSLTSITIPNSVQSIGNEVFRFCESLTSVTIPNSVKSIGNEAFSYCYSLTSITIPEGVQTIGDKAFAECHSLTSITIPDSVQSIGLNAFSSCKELIIPEYSPVLNNLHDLFRSNKGSCKLTIKMKNGTYRKTAMTASLSPFEKRRMLDFDYLLTFGHFYSEKIYEEHRIIAIIDRLKDNKNPVNTETKAFFVNYLQERIRKVIKITVSTEDDLKFLLKTGVINELNLSDVQKFFKKNNPAFLGLCVLEKQEDKNFDPLQQKCEQLLIENKWNVELVKKYKFVSFESVRLKNRKPAPENYSRALTAILMFSQFDENFTLADQISDKIDIRSYRTLMQEYYDKLSYSYAVTDLRKKVIIARPICRFANGKKIKSIYSEFEESKFKIEILDAIMLSRTREAQLILYQNQMLDKYAMLHGLNKNWLEYDLLDSGLDKERKKYYDLGNHTVAAHMLSNFTFEFINLSTGKVTKTLPKRGADSEKYKEAEKHFKELKQNIRKVAKLRTSGLLHDFLKGNPTEAEIWKKMHFDNPVLHDIGKMILWRQGKDTFIMRDDRLENYSGNSYEITDEPVYVAHPMDMKDTEILYWQQYFAKNQLKQPFIQIWEPVCDLSKVDLLSNVLLPLYRFENRDIHGIHVSYKKSVTKPEFEFEDCLVDIRQANLFEGLKHDTKFKIVKFHVIKDSKMANHIMAYLLRLAAFNVVLKDDDAIIPILPAITYELINKLLEFALEKKCTHVSAILLDYREKNFSKYDPMDEFTLEF